MSVVYLATLLLLQSAKADTPSGNAVAPIVFPPSENWDGVDGPWSTFALRLGQPEQVVRVVPSTSGYYTTAIPPSACNTTSDPTSCDSARAGIFDPSQSTTWQDQGLFGLGIENNLGYSVVDGDFGLDSVGLGITSDANLTFLNQVIAEILEPETDPAVSNQLYLGTFGLGTQPTNFTTFTDPHPSFFTALKNANSIPSYTWSYTAGAQYQLTGVLGSLVFGGYDSSRFIPNNVTIPMSPDVSRDLVVGVQSITSTAGGSNIGNILLPSGGIFAFVDSELPYIWLPEDACTAFEHTFGLTWNATNEMYLVNDTLHSELQAKNISITFTLGVDKTGGETVDIQLPYAAFDLTATPPLVKNTTSYFPLKRAANDTQYTLGRAFLQEAYLIADYERANFSISQSSFQSGARSNIVTIESIANSQSQPQPQPSSNLSSIGGGAIAGIVIGVLAILITATLLFWAWKKKKFPFKAPPATTDTENEIGQALTTPAPAYKATEKPDDLGPELEGFIPKPLSEAMDTPQERAEMEVNGTVGYLMAKGRQEMEDNIPVGQELGSPDSQLHEMFDESVYHKLMADEADNAQGRGIKAPQTLRMDNEPQRSYSWTQTPARVAVGRPVYPGVNGESDAVTRQEGVEAGERHAAGSQDLLVPSAHRPLHESAPAAAATGASGQSADPS